MTVNSTAWTHFREITGIINRLKDNVRQIVSDINKLKTMKEGVLDNAELRAELKKVIDVYPDASMESLTTDYQQFQSLKDWMIENNFI